MLFLALTFVLVIIVVMLCPDAKTAIMIVGLLFGFVFAYDVMVDGHALSTHRGGHHIDSYGKFCCTVAPATSTLKRPVRTVSHRDFGRPRGYPGAIDPEDDYDTAQSLKEGHRDRAVGDNVFAPDGNPFNLNRVGAPYAASACFDDEANDDELDGDERINYQARSRNDPTRVTAGTMNRRCDLDKYLREEVEEEDDREWWGRHED